MSQGQSSGDQMSTPMPMPPSSMSNGAMNTNMMMQMSFFWGKDVTILFKGWPGHSLGMYILALALVILLSMVVEILSILSPAEPGNKSPIIDGLTQAGVYALRTALTYMVMLSVMSFNLGIFIATVVGHVLGFLLVKWRGVLNGCPASEALISPPSSAPKV